MRKVFILIFALVTATGLYAQYPGGILKPGADSSLTDYKGGVKLRPIIYGYVDTAAANLTRIKNEAGALIFTTSDNKLRFRNDAKTAWLETGKDGVTFIDSLYQDSCIIRTFSNNVKDTICFTGGGGSTGGSVDSYKTLQDILNYSWSVAPTFPGYPLMRSYVNAPGISGALEIGITDSANNRRGIFYSQKFSNAVGVGIASFGGAGGSSNITVQDSIINFNVTGSETNQVTFSPTKGIITHNINIPDGAGVEKVLTSDADGNATWQPPSSGSLQSVWNATPFPSTVTATKDDGTGQTDIIYSVGQNIYTQNRFSDGHLSQLLQEPDSIFFALTDNNTYNDYFSFSHANGFTTSKFKFVHPSLGAGKILTSDIDGNATWQTFTNNNWGLTGNAGTSSSTNFIGTTDNTDFQIRRNNLAVLRFIGSSNFALGFSNNTPNLSTGLRNQMFGAGLSNPIFDYRVSTGSNNISFLSGGYTNTTGSYNISIGSLSFTNNTSANTTGNGNISIGQGAASSYITTGNKNISIGEYANENLYLNGSRNIAIGNYTNRQWPGGYVPNGTQGSRNIIIGDSINLPVGNASNQLNIGNLIYGNGLDGNAENISTGNIGIGIKVPSEKLTVDGLVLSKFKELAADPTTSDIPAGFTGVYRNTTSGNTYLWANVGGTLIKVQLN